MHFSQSILGFILALMVILLAVSFFVQNTMEGSLYASCSFLCGTIAFYGFSNLNQNNHDSE
jgi:hypothetical protein